MSPDSCKKYHPINIHHIYLIYMNKQDSVLSNLQRLKRRKTQLTNQLCNFDNIFYTHLFTYGDKINIKFELV